MITIQQLTKKFGNFTALDGLSLDIRSGCIYGIVGPNGSGKSTLLRIIALLEPPDSGTVLFEGRPPGPTICICAVRLPSCSRRRTCSRVP